MIEDYKFDIYIPFLREENKNPLLLYQSQTLINRKVYDPTLEDKYLNEILKFTLFHHTFEPKQKYTFPTSAAAYFIILDSLKTKEKQGFLQTTKEIIESNVHSSHLSKEEKEQFIKDLMVTYTKSDYLKIICVCSLALFITITPLCIALATNKQLALLICFISALLPYMAGLYFLENNLNFHKHKDAIYNINSYMTWLEDWYTVIMKTAPITYQANINHASYINMGTNNNLNSANNDLMHIALNIQDTKQQKKSIETTRFKL